MICVRAAGLLTTVQDLGRPGYGAMGISACGAADTAALRLGNRLAGNPDSSAALEMTLLGGEFVFEEDAGAALAGSDFGAELDGEPFPPWTSRWVRAGQSLRVGPTRSGARCYLCVHGGISVPLYLGSASTHLLSGLGGLGGRALKNKDCLHIGPPTGRFRPRSLRQQAILRLAPRFAPRVTRGPQWDWFGEDVRRRFLDASYQVAEESNRFGIRLEGPVIEADVQRELITEGAPLGAIQVPPSGYPIILFVEQQTTGGYPKVANVIAADMSAVGQYRPRDEIRFELVTFEQAQALLRHRETLLNSPDLFTP